MHLYCVYVLVNNMNLLKKKTACHGEPCFVTLIMQSIFTLILTDRLVSTCSREYQINVRLVQVHTVQTIQFCFWIYQFYQFTILFFFLLKL